MNAMNRLFVALDVASEREASSIMHELSAYVRNYKVGLELISAIGIAGAIRLVHSAGAKVFVDAKLHDIPATIARAAKVIAGHGPDFFNVHASGGATMVAAAASNKGAANLVAVTVLTSHDEVEARNIFGKTAVDAVMTFAGYARDGGADTVLCSPLELTRLRESGEFGGMQFMTPGVRPTWAAANDQKRIMTPGEAIAAGATYLVVGRPILNPPEGISRTEAAERIIDEIEGALSHLATQ